MPSRDPQKRRAQHAVERALKRGDLSHPNTQACAECGHIWYGGAAHEYAHSSYQHRDWLKVIPLCARCHRRLDANVPPPGVKPGTYRDPQGRFIKKKVV